MRHYELIHAIDRYYRGDFLYEIDIETKTVIYSISSYDRYSVFCTKTSNYILTSDSLSLPEIMKKIVEHVVRQPIR